MSAERDVYNVRLFFFFSFFFFLNSSAFRQLFHIFSAT